MVLLKITWEPCVQKVTLKANNKVDVLMKGAPDRLALELDYARWEFSTIWN